MKFFNLYHLPLGRVAVGMSFTVLLTISSVFSLNGQNIGLLTGPIDPYTDLNSSDISTHLLWDKRGGMNRIRDFNGLNAPPTNLRIWEQLYADIFRMTTSNYSPPLQVISQMRNDAYGTVSNATIKLGLLSINYDTIKSNAFSDNLLTVGVDKKFHDWPFRTASPYGTTRLFALTAFNEVALQPNVKFVLPTQFYYQNLNESPLSIQLDCGDGQGFRTFSWNQPINTNFITGGEKLITIRVTYSSGVYTSSTKLKVAGIGQSASGLNGPPPSDYIAPDEVWDIQGDSWTSPCDGSTSANSGRAYIRFGNGNRKLTKPIIFIDGIDFGRQITIDETRGNQVIGFGTIGWYNLASTEAINQTNPELARFRELSDQFKNNGYDIIFLDFRDGADYIQRCASVLKNLIIRVNSRKGQDATNGIVFPNMIIGPSMGGQVARFGLRYMEMAGINHCTSTYVSFDSPQQGANIPMGLQEFIRYQGLTLGVEFAEQKWENALNRPAAKQLLYQHRADDALCIRQQFVQERTALGYPSTRNIAITDGSLDAMPQAYAAGTNILDFDLRSDLIFWSSAKIVAANGDNSLVFQGKFPKKTISGAVLFGACAISLIAAVLLSWITAGGALIGASTVCSLAFVLGGTGLLPISFYEHTYFMPTNSVSADHVPGCLRGDIKDIADAIEDGIPGFMRRSFLTLNKASDNFCFMPTVSTLDIQNPPNGMFSNVRQLVGNFDRPDKQFTPFDAIFRFELNETQNLPHVQITAGMVTWILQQCVIGFERGTNLTTIYNYGYQRDKLGSMNILNGGHLKINAPGATGFVNISPEPNATNSSFTVSTTSESCGTVGVNIENGGQLSIGESSHSGILRLIGGTTLTVKNGGTLRLNNNAQLIVESGGRLIIEAGANINLVSTESKIIVKNGGQLIFNGQPIVTGNGHFRFEQGNIFTLNSNLILTGAGRPNPLIKIAGGATIVVNNPFEWRINNAAVIHETGLNDTTHIFLRNGATFRANNTLFDDQQVILFGPRTATFIKVEEPIDLNNDPDDVDYGFDNCIFQNTGIAIELDVPYAQSDPFDWRNVNVELRNSTFTNCQALYADRSYITLVENCTLTNANIDIAHTYWLNVKNTTIRSNLFGPTDENYASFGYGIKATHVGHFWFRENSLIDGWGTGIDASSGLNWNIIMTDQSTIQRCATGIHLNGTKYNGNVDLGLLHMDCGRLIKNGAAIKGQDIIFSAYTRNGTANVFTPNINNPSGLFIESIFQNRFDTDLWLHGNYWNGTTPATTPVNSAWSFLTRHNFPQPAIPWVGTIHINPDLRTSEFDPAVQGCGGVNLRGVHDDPLGKKTIVKINGVLYDVKKQYDAALRILKKDKFKDALNTFRPIAQIPRSIRDTASATVKHFVDMAQALTLDMGVQTRSVSSSGWLPESIVGIVKPENSLVLSPNPANEQFDIILPNGNYDIQVFDALGKRVFSKNTEGVTTVDIRTWQNGIYMVSLLDKNSKKKTFSKVVVQH